MAQLSADSVRQDVSRMSEKISVDSLEQQLDLPQLPDSLLPPYQTVDSIRSAFNQEADSIKSEYQSAVSKIESQQGRITNKIDSLQQLNLPTDKFAQKLDSLNQLQKSTQAKFTSKLDDLKSKTTGKLNALDLPPQYKEPLQALTKNVEGLSLNSEALKIPSLEIPGYSIPKMDGLGDFTSKAGDIGDLGGVPKIETPVGDLGKVTEQSQSLPG